MAYLPHFEYDLFISYGWGGTAEANRGDRAWMARFRERLQAEVDAELGRGKSGIFLDADASDEGKAWPWLSEMIRRTAVLLFMVSPGSVNKDGWCLKELREFLQHCGAFGEAPDNQVYVGIIRGVEDDQWPEELTDRPRQYFGDREGPRFFQADIGDLESRSTTAGRALRVLAQNLAKRLGQLRVEIDRTTYLAATSRQQKQFFDRMMTELTRPDRRRRVLTPKVVTRDESLRLLRWSRFSIHLLDEQYDSEQEGVQRIQLAAAQEWFRETRKSTMLWPAPTWKLPERMPADFMPMADIVQQGFEFFESVVSQRVDSAFVPRDAPARKSDEERFVYVHCVEKDLDKIEKLRGVLNAKGIELRTPLFSGGDEAERFEEDKAFVREYCAAAAVYYGDRPDLDVYRICNKLRDTLRSAGKPGAVLINPPEDKRRRGFRHPGFHVYYCPDQCEPDDLADFLEKILGRTS